MGSESEVLLKERNQIPEDVSIKLQQYLSKMKTKRRIEIAILISGISIIGIFWIWILAIQWKSYRRIEEEFVSLWRKYPKFNPEGQFRTVFNEETYSLFTQKRFLYTLRRKNDQKIDIIKNLTIPLFGYAYYLIFLFLIGLNLSSILFVILLGLIQLYNIIILDKWNLSGQMELLWTFLVCLIIFPVIFIVIYGVIRIRSPFIKELKKENKRRRERERKKIEK